MIAATAAVAKVAAAAAASSPYSSFLPSMAVTPMAQAHRLKKVPSIDSKHPNGVSFGVAGGISNVKILSKPKDSQELNGSDFHRSSVTSTQSKGSIHGMPNSNFVGKHQGRYSLNNSKHCILCNLMFNCVLFVLQWFKGSLSLMWLNYCRITGAALTSRR